MEKKQGMGVWYGPGFPEMLTGRGRKVVVPERNEKHY
jgi:hypothetical protein